MATLTYNIGPKLGDFIHGLVVPKYMYDISGTKAVIYLSSEGCTFTKPIEQTYEELIPLMKEQDFVEDFLLHDKQQVNYDIFKFRQSPELFQATWNEIYFHMFLPGVKKLPINYKWLTVKEPIANLGILNRSPRPMSEETKEAYKTHIQHYGPKFVYSDPAQFEAFPLSVRILRVDNLMDMIRNIAGAQMFIGNQSAPLAIATALGVSRIAELRQSPDQAHYKTSEYDTTIQTFIGD